MLVVGDHVYHRGINANGIVVSVRSEIDHRDPIGVKFQWGKYISGVTLHNLGGAINENKGLWCSNNKLVKISNPRTSSNSISMIGGRSLDRQIREIMEIPRRRRGDGSDIVINYGKPDHRVARSVLCLNRKLITNKFEQCTEMIRRGVSVPEISRSFVEGFIQKPFKSFAGYNIFEGSDIDRRKRNVYYQRKVQKVREFRAHVTLWENDKVQYIQEKTVSDRTRLCWNKHQGGEFSVVYSKLLGVNELQPSLLNRIKNQATNAVKSVQMDFGGVDLALSEDNNLYVFEVNSRCGLRERSLAIYKYLFWRLKGIDIQEYIRNRWTFN